MAMIGPNGELQLQCPVCDSVEFRQEHSRQDSSWGFTSHSMTLVICQRCSYVFHFYGGNSIFDFD